MLSLVDRYKRTTLSERPWLVECTNLLAGCADIFRTLFETSWLKERASSNEENELNQLIGRPPHEETAKRLWKSLTKEDQLTILRFKTRQSQSRCTATDKNGKYTLVKENLFIKEENEAVLYGVVEYRNPWWGETSDGNVLINLVDVDRTDVALKLVTLFAATDIWIPFVGKLFDYVNDEHSRVTDSLLAYAARAGCLAVFKDFLSTAFSHQKNEPNGDTLLHIAAEHGHVDDVRELLKAGWKCKSNGKSWTPLHSAAAAKMPNEFIADLLVQHIRLQQGDSYLNHSSNGGNTALHIAAYNVNMTAAFLQQLRDVDPFAINNKRLTALEIAAENPDVIIPMLDVFLPLMSRVELDDEVGRAPELNRVTSKLSATDGIIASVGNVVMVPVNNAAEYRFKLSLRKLLLKTCVRNGMVDAVVRLMEHGIDKSDILHVIIEESVAHPEKVDQLKVIYRAIVDHVMRPRHPWLKTSENTGFCEEDVPERDQIDAAIVLIESPSKQYHGLNSIELAIHKGAWEMLKEIVNTPNVFRFQSEVIPPYSGAKTKIELVRFDVTNMTNETYDNNTASKTSSPKTCSSGDNGSIEQPQSKTFNLPQACYLEEIVEHGEIWRESDILDTEPFKKLTAPHLALVQRIYSVIGCLQMLFMIILSVYHIPSTCSLNEQFGLNITWCETNELDDSCSQDDEFYQTASLVNCLAELSPSHVTRTYPNVAWLIWPIAMGLFAFCSATYDFFSWLATKSCCKKWFSSCCCCCCCSNPALTGEQSSNSDEEVRALKIQTEPTLINLLSTILKQMLPLAFAVSVVIWYDSYKNATRYPRFLEKVAVIFLFGWLLAFFHLSSINRRTYMFSLILKEIIIKDVFINFMPIFVFTVVGFGTAMHALSQTVLPADTVESLNVTIYNTFLTSINLGNFADATFDPNFKVVHGRLGFYRFMFSVYVSFVSIILLQVLISMLTNRYDSALAKAEYMWRFDCTSTVLTLQRLQKRVGWLLRKIGLGDCLVCNVGIITYFLYKGERLPATKNNRHVLTLEASEV